MGTDTKNLVGTTLSGRYRIDKAIGEGGMGAIFQATQLSLGRAVAIKVVKSVHEDSSDAVRRFELETEVIARLAHPNIVQVVDAGKADDGTMYLAMELLQGESIRQLLRREGTLPVARVLAIVEDVASALSAAHAGGVIHRDLKAENVMVVKAAGKQEIAKVLDFGVAKLTTKTEAPPQTGSGFVAGTPGCIAPEQMLGKSDDPRSDLYSVGVLMFEMLAGEAPFVSSSSVELMMRHLTEPAPRVAGVAHARGKPDVPAALDELVASLLVKDPEARPKSAESLVEIVSSLRDAGRSTQADLRLPTPMGGFSVPTPGSVSMPTATGATPIPFGAPSGALVVQKPVTAPTTTMPVPVPVPTQIVARARKPLRVAAKVAIIGLVVFFGSGAVMWAYELYADRPIPGMPWLERESWKRWNEMDEQLLYLDLAPLKQNARFILQEKQQDVPMAYLYLAHVAILERQPLSVIDGYHAQAKVSAERRAKAMGRSRHTQLMVDALTESDPEKARSKWQIHIEVGGCTDAFVEEHMFAQRQMLTEVDGQKIVNAFTPLLEKYGDNAYPFAKIGYARGLLLLGRIEEARVIIEPLLAARPFNVPLIDAMVDVDLARGNAADAIKRIDTHLADDDDPHLNIRRAVIKLRDDPRALDGMRARLDSLPDANPMKALGFSYIGHALASRGQFKEAEEMWQRGKASATGVDAPTRTAELAVYASMFGAIIGDVDIAKRWLDEYQQVRDGMPEGPTARRVKAVALGNRIMLAAEDMRSPNAAAAARDIAWLKAEPIDIPLLTQTIDWHATVAQGKLDEALQVAEQMPACWRDGHLGITAAMQASRATDPAKKRERLGVAIERLKGATTEKARLACTNGDDLVSFIQTVEQVKSLGYLATAACFANDRATASDALTQIHALWPHASSPSASPEWLAYVQAVDEWLKAPPGVGGQCVPKPLHITPEPAPTPAPTPAAPP